VLDGRHWDTRRLAEPIHFIGTIGLSDAAIKSTGTCG